MSTTAKNKAGTLFQLQFLVNGNARVLKHCANYSLGKIHYTWRVDAPTARMPHKEFQGMAKNGLPIETAKALFEKRIKGNAK